MRVHMQLEYDNNEGGVETTTSVDPTDPDDRQMLHDMLDEYLDHGILVNPDDAYFRVWGVCRCHEVPSTQE